ncbi:MAG: flagellar basal body L-ring protein FlgH [bacterium]
MRNRIQKFFLFLLLLGLSVWQAVQAEPVLPSGKSIYADPVACNVGDILTVVVKMDTAVIQRVRASSQKESKAGIEWLSNILSDVFSRSLDSSYRSISNVDDNTNQSFQTTFSAVVTEVLLNGNLALEGEREVVVNGEKQTLAFTGFVRPQDIARDNTVLSNRVMGLKFRYTGPLPKKGKPGLIQQVLQIFF